MANVGQFLRQIMLEMGDYPAPGEVVHSWMQSRYASVLERAPWAFLQKEDTINTVAEITAGTVTLTLGSATVTESTSNANGWTSAVEGRYFRASGDTEFYQISTFGDANPDTLTLERVYEGSNTTLAGYKIFQRFYSLASDVRDVLSMTILNPVAPLERVSLAELNRAMMNRPESRETPLYWAPAGRDSSNIYRVEMYPIPTRARGVLYHYIQTTPSLSDADTDILPQVDVRLLRSGVLADYWAWRGATVDNEGALVMKGMFEAEFEKRMQEMVIRESPSLYQGKMRLPSRFTRHRLSSKWERRREIVDSE